MVKLTVAVLLGVFLSGHAIDTKPPGGSAKPAFQKGKFPWYDPDTDAPRPIWPPMERENSSSNSESKQKKDTPKAPERETATSEGSSSALGGSIATLVMVLVIAAGVAVILWAFYRFAPLPAPEAKVTKAVESRKARFEALPPGLTETSNDPWSEAVRMRSAGNLSDAIVALYLYELLTLRDRNLIRLAPGKTGRQLVRSIHDAWLRGRVEPTLRLFEASYYGHHKPSREDFDAAWREAEAFRGRMLTGALS